MIGTDKLINLVVVKEASNLPVITPAYVGKSVMSSWLSVTLI
ncbi:MAG: hypothetical protein ACSLEM_01340 [Candidatus Malihini olakiniferum]